MLDAVIVGARCAGSPTAMLLARQGYSVAALDRATFPSDTLSTHFITADGCARLQQWGLFDRVVATGCEPHPGIARTMQGMHIPASPEDPPGLAPRRTVLDKLLVEAAREAGADVREGVTVESLIVEDGRVVGVRGRRGGEPFEERAKVVIGADGRESFVARSVAADEYNPGGGTTAGYYTYFKNWPNTGPELHLGGGAAHFVFPTNNGEVCVAIEFTADRFKTFREDVDGNFMADLAAFEPFAARVAQAERTEKISGQAPHKSFYRKPFGAGWALVGDAGYYRDPLLGQGINDAFRDADNLSSALNAVFSGGRAWDETLAEYENSRNEATQMIYGLTNLLCQDLNPSPQILQMMAGGPPPQPAAVG